MDIYLKPIAIVGLLIYLVMVLIRKANLERFPFDQYLIEDLAKRGLIYLYSKKSSQDHPEAEKIPLVASAFKKHAAMMLFSGSIFSWSGKLFLIFSVGFEDKESIEHETLAAIEYNGYSKIKVKAISWHPSINLY